MTTATPYEALLIGGPYGIAARIIGAHARRLSKTERRKLGHVLAMGYTIQVLSPDLATWQAVRGDLYRQLGLRA